MRKFLLLALICAASSAAAVELTDSTRKVRVRLTGRVDAVAFTDTYRSAEVGGGLQYLFPSRPIFDLQGVDQNRDGSLRFGISTSRLGVGASSQLTEKVSAEGYVEMDLMGPSSTNVVGPPRLRHAFVKVNIGRSGLLFGQTSHLMHVDELAPSTVTFGGGYPINTLARPIQIRFSQHLGKRWAVVVAASMFAGHAGTMQSSAMTPDISARAIYKSANGSMVGAAGGFQSIEPRMEGMNRNSRMNTGYAAVFEQANFCKGYAIRAFAAYGGNMDVFGLTGGFAPTSSLGGYSALITTSGWADFETAVYAGFQFGVFGGYQKNLGSDRLIDKTNIVTAKDQLGLDSFYRVAPRAWYHYKMLSFGLEYMYTEALWAHTFNTHYRATSTLAPVGDHRVTLLARFNF